MQLFRLPAYLENNLLIREGRTAVRLPNLVASIFLSLGFLIGASIIGAIPQIPIYLMTGTLQPASPVLQAVILVFSFAPIFLLIWLWVHFFEKRAFSSLGLHLQGAGLKYLRGFALGVVMFSAAVAALALFGKLTYVPPSPGTTALTAGPAILIILVGWIVQGPGEEILYRGWAMPVIATRYKLLLGVLISSAIFAVSHSLNTSFSLLALVNIFLVGIFLCLFALRDGALWGVFGWHTAWNWVQGNIFGLSVSGMPLNGSSLVHFNLNGAALLTGGGFGPEGGLAVTLVVVLGLVGAWLWGRQRSPEIPPQNPV
jgi:uncharacterized protein